MNNEEKQQDTSSSNPQSTPLFALGRMVATPGALAAIEAADQIPLDFLVRHARGDWGTNSYALGVTGVPHSGHWRALRFHSE